MPSDSHETAIALLHERQRQTDLRLDKQDRTLESIAESLKLLTRIEAQNSQLAEDVKGLRVELADHRTDTAGRLAPLEAAAPLNAQVRKGATALVGLVLASVAGGVLALVRLAP